MSFSDLGISSRLIKKLSEQNYTQPYPIQRETIPAILSGKDVLGISPTGSGKTAGYVLPILMGLHENVISKNRHVKVLVIVPTRELAMQVKVVFETFGSAMMNPVKSLAVYGGVSINPQMMAMNNVDVLVATPGRLLELVDSNAVHLSEVTTLVLDEADKMLNQGFEVEMNRILEMLPRKRQNLLFSATLSEDLEPIKRVLLKDPVICKIANVENTEENVNLDLIRQLGYFVSEERKGPLLRYLIKKNEMKQVLVFTSSVFEADKVTDKLRKNGIDAAAMHSKKSQGARTDALSRFKAGKLNVLVATDLISRGIDIAFLPHVINYELPRSPKDYVHRIGRTGRAENPGEAITFVTPADSHHFRVIQKKMGKWVTMIDSEPMDLLGY